MSVIFLPARLYLSTYFQQRSMRNHSSATPRAILMHFQNWKLQEHGSKLGKLFFSNVIMTAQTPQTRAIESSQRGVRVLRSRACQSKIDDVVSPTKSTHNCGSWNEMICFFLLPLTPLYDWLWARVYSGQFSMHAIVFLLQIIIKIVHVRLQRA